MMGLLSVFIGVGTPLGALEMGALATLSVEWAIAGNAVLGLLLIAPLVWVSPLITKPVSGPGAVYVRPEVPGADVR
jgi:hypothetical protein